MGPLVDRRSLDRIQAHLRAGQAQGAILRQGGSQVLADTGGVTGAGPDNVLVREELFGPVLAVQVITDESVALRVAHDTPYGLRRPSGRTTWVPRTESPASSRPARCGSTATRKAT